MLSRRFDLLPQSVSWPDFHQHGHQVVFYTPGKFFNFSSTLALHTKHGSGVGFTRVIRVHEKPFFPYVTSTHIRSWQGDAWIVSE